MSTTTAEIADPEHHIRLHINPNQGGQRPHVIGTYKLGDKRLILGLWAEGGKNGDKDYYSLSITEDTGKKDPPKFKTPNLWIFRQQKDTDPDYGTNKPFDFFGCELFAYFWLRPGATGDLEDNIRMELRSDPLKEGDSDEAKEYRRRMAEKRKPKKDIQLNEHGEPDDVPF